MKTFFQIREELRENTSNAVISEITTGLAKRQAGGIDMKYGRSNPSSSSAKLSIKKSSEEPERTRTHYTKATYRNHKGEKENWHKGLQHHTREAEKAGHDATANHLKRVHQDFKDGKGLNTVGLTHAINSSKGQHKKELKKAFGAYSRDDSHKVGIHKINKPKSAQTTQAPTKKPSLLSRIKRKIGMKEDTGKLDEISPELMTRYAKKAIPQQFKKHDYARRRGHNYMTKTGGDDKAKKAQAQADRRKKGIDSIRKRWDPNDHGQHKTGKASRPHGGLRPGKGSSYHVDPSKVGGFRSKYLDQ